MMFFSIAGSVFLLLVLFWLFFMQTARRGADFSRLTPYVYAHRGLFEKDQSIPENSLAAFRRAVEHGFGIELDIQLTSDGQIVVFHDDTLKRMCGIDRYLNEFTFAELQDIPLADSEERIPLFSDVLKIVEGKVPLIIEFKYYGNRRALCEKASALLDSYSGDYCIESFHPQIGQWFLANRPQVLRGQLSHNYLKHGGLSGIAAFVAALQMLNVVSKPHFVAFRFSDRNWLPLRICRALYRPQMAYWTIQSQEDLDECTKRNALCIFEHFIPKL